MKKLLLPAVLTVAACLGLAADAHALGKTFGLIPHRNGCCCAAATFCVRQYNAFTPVCSGTVYCDGCCPLGSPGCGPGNFVYQGVPAGPMGYGHGCCGPAGCGVGPGAFAYMNSNFPVRPPMMPPANNPLAMLPPSPMPPPMQPPAYTAGYGWPVMPWATAAAPLARPSALNAPFGARHFAPFGGPSLGGGARRST